MLRDKFINRLRTKSGTVHKDDLENREIILGTESNNLYVKSLFDSDGNSELLKFSNVDDSLESYDNVWSAQKIIDYIPEGVVYEFSTGLTKEDNVVSVNESQYITQLINLDSSGLVQTDSNGNLTVDTSSYLTSVSFSDLTGSPSDVINAGDNLSWDGNTLNAVDTDTTYTAGTGLSLSDTEFSTNDSEIDHNSLNNYVSNEHIDWTVSQTQDIHSDNYTDTTYTVGTGLSLSGTEISTNDGEINHNSLNNYISNEHIDWTSTSENLNTSGNITTSNLMYEIASSAFINEENIGSSHTFDFNSASFFTGVLNEDTSITISNLDNGQSGTITLYYDGVSQRSISWSGIDLWADEKITTGPSENDGPLILILFNDSKNVIASSSINELTT